ncbi:MAG: neutral zinc metallopeptidase [Nocardioidaceae bacterium]|nr:neutral zinc metallopeptidase [Nocardioidaceae bacterium]
MLESPMITRHRRNGGGCPTGTEDASGAVLIQDLTEHDVAEAIGAAKTVGEDYIQKRSGGGIDEESWTHGSSAQRQKWFLLGYDQGTVEACDTFSAPQV